MQVKVGIVDSGVAPAQRGALAACVGIAAGGAGVERAVAHDDPVGHGTAVAQIILAEAPQAQLVSAQAFAGRRQADAACVAAGIDWCLEQGARIVNLSLGLATDQAVLGAACRAAVAHGAIVVAAFPARGGSVYPAAYPGVLAASGDARCGPWCLVGHRAAPPLWSGRARRRWRDPGRRQLRRRPDVGAGGALSWVVARSRGRRIPPLAGSRGGIPRPRAPPREGVCLMAGLELGISVVDARRLQQLETATAPAMPKALAAFLDDAEMAALVPAQVTASHLYFGSEFCEHLFPEPAALERAIAVAARLGLVLVLATPVANDRLVGRILEAAGQLPQGAEILVNDWGVASALRSAQPQRRLVAGTAAGQDDQGSAAAFGRMDEAVSERLRRCRLPRHPARRCASAASSWTCRRLRRPAPSPSTASASRCGRRSPTSPRDASARSAPCSASGRTSSRPPAPAIANAWPWSKSGPSLR